MIKQIVRFSIRNSVLVNVIMVGIIIMGIVALTNLPRELYPKIDFNWVFVVVLHPGVSPEEVEKFISIPIEDAVKDIDYINTISSISSEGKSRVLIKIKSISESKYDRVLQDIRTEVNKVHLPDGAEDPYIMSFSSYDFVPLISVVISGDVSELKLNKYADELKSELEEIDHISGVNKFGGRDREIWVQTDPAKMKGYNISFDEIAVAILSRNINQPAGTIDIGRKVYSIRTIGEFDNIEEIGNVIVRTGRGGGYLRLKDVAAVADTFERRRTTSRTNGKNSINLSITKDVEGNTIGMIEQIREVASNWNKRHPNVKIILTGDTSVRIKDILGKLEWNAVVGMLFVALLLLIFLGWRNAIFAALGIPVTFMLTFIFMWQHGDSFNSNSLFGLVLVLGMLVDDAIVVLENSYRYIEMGYNSAKAVAKGAVEVAGPVISSVMTTIAAFLPLMLLSGIIGRFMKIIPIIVSFALVASLFEAFLILPSHIADWSGTPKKKHTHRSSKFLEKVRHLHLRFLKKSIRHRYRVLLIFLVLAALAGMGMKLIPVEMFAHDEISLINVWVRTPSGTSLGQTDKVIKEIEKRAMSLPSNELIAVSGNAGIMQTEEEWINSPDVGQVKIDIVERWERKRGIREIIEELKQKCVDIPGIKSIQFEEVKTGPPVGKPIEVKVKGKYLDKLREVADLVEKELATIDGVENISDNFNKGILELRIKVNEEKAALLHLTVKQISGIVKAAFNGMKVGVYREGDEEMNIRLIFSASGRNSLSDVADMLIPLPSGGSVALSDVADISTAREYTDIRRYNRERAITISADVDKNKTSALRVNQELKNRFRNKIQKIYPDYRLDFGGEMKEFAESFSNINELFAFGLILVYIILSAQFKSWMQPFIIMFTIPFAFIGAMFGLMVNGFPFSITTMYGIVALAGIVVNDSTVLIDFINKSRLRGDSKWWAIMQGGRVRLRPILLTSITTIGGLLPMAVGIGGKSEVWQPLANTIVWGLTVSTLMTLFVIPAIYAIGEDIRERLGFKPYKTIELD